MKSLRKIKESFGKIDRKLDESIKVMKPNNSPNREVILKENDECAVVRNQVRK